jgi:phage shock protein PspC (stress-responsive transcriptional regulator)
MQKRLYRTSRGKVLAGVCAGLGEYFNIDPVVVRVLFVLGTFLGGPGIIIYLILMLLLPDDSMV